MDKTTRAERRRVEKITRKKSKSGAVPGNPSGLKVLAGLVSSREAARFLGVTIQRISQLVREGVLVRPGHGLIGSDSVISYKNEYGGRRRRLSSRWEHFDPLAGEHDPR